jgi:hypothetical protein
MRGKKIQRIQNKEKKFVTVSGFQLASELEFDMDEINDSRSE